MKNLIFLISFIFISTCSFAQSYTGAYNYLEYNGGKFRNEMYMPYRDTTWHPSRAGAQTHRPQDNKVYEYNGTTWTVLGSGSASLPFSKIAVPSDKMTVSKGGDTLYFNTINNLNVFNAKDYGAKGDGSTNDKAALTAAITAASVKGGIVFLQPGKYNIATKLSLLSNVKLLGDNAEIHFTGTGSAVIEAAGITNFAVEGIKVTGNALDATNPYGISITNASHDGYIARCSFKGVYLGLFIGDVSTTSSYKITVRDNDFDSIGLNGIGLNCFGKDFIIDGNRFNRCGLIATATGTVNLGAGIEFRGATNSTITNNHFYNLQYGGTGGVDMIRLENATEGATSTVQHVTVENNYGENCSGYGVRMQMVQYCDITRNTFIGSAGGQQGVYVYSDGTLQKISEENHITNNTFKNYPTQSALTLEGTGTYYTRKNIISGNIFDSCYNAASIFKSDNNTFSGNKAYNGTGQAFLQVSGTGNVFDANEARGHLTGLAILSGYTPFINNNVFYGNTQGIYIAPEVVYPAIGVNYVDSNASFDISNQAIVNGGGWYFNYKNNEVRTDLKVLPEGRATIGITGVRWPNVFFDTLYTHYFAEDLLPLVSNNQGVGSSSKRWGAGYFGVLDVTAGVTTDGATGITNGYKINRAGWDFSSRWGSTGMQGNEVFLSQNYDFYNHKRDDSTLKGVSILQDPLYGTTKFLIDHYQVASIDSTGKLQIGLPAFVGAKDTVLYYDPIDSTLKSAIPIVASATVKVLPDADYTILNTDGTLILPEPTTARTITLPAASTMPNKRIVLKCKSLTTGRWILNGSFVQSATTGSAPFTEDYINSGLAFGQTYELVSDGSKWYDVK